MMKVIIAGGRDYKDYERLKKISDHMLQNQNDVEIVCGLARGADLLGKKYAEENKYNIKYFPAEWDVYGKSAGYIRNEQMAKYSDALICFWNGKSKGSKHMIDIAKKHNLKIKIVNYDK